VTTLAEPPVPPLFVCANATFFVAPPIVTWPAASVSPWPSSNVPRFDALVSVCSHSTTGAPGSVTSSA
jgi:hypothetical protein